MMRVSSRLSAAECGDMRSLERQFGGFSRLFRGLWQVSQIEETLVPDSRKLLSGIAECISTIGEYR